MLRWNDPTVATALTQVFVGCLVSFIVMKFLKFFGLMAAVVIMLLEMMRRNKCSCGCVNVSAILSKLQKPLPAAIAKVEEYATEDRINRNFLAGLFMGICVSMK